MRLYQAPGQSGGYQQIFTKGIDRLPEKPCAGAVDRSIVADALPAARTADKRGKITESVNNRFTLWCYVRTEDSTVSGEAESGFATEEIWRQPCQARLMEIPSRYPSARSRPSAWKISRRCMCRALPHSKPTTRWRELTH